MDEPLDSGYYLKTENIELRKELCTKNTNWQKEKALYEMKLGQFQTIIDDHNEKEKRMKDTHRKMLETMDVIEKNKLQDKKTNTL